MSTARILASDTIIEHGADGAVYARSPHVLGAYPGRITDCLEHWAAHAPDRTFLARRDAEGAWRSVTYAAALNRVRRIAQSLIDRRLSAGQARGHPVRQQHRAWAACAGGDVCRRGLRADRAILLRCSPREFTTLKALWQRSGPGSCSRLKANATSGRCPAVGDSGGGNRDLLAGPLAVHDAVRGAGGRPRDVGRGRAHARVGSGHDREDPLSRRDRPAGPRA